MTKLDEIIDLAEFIAESYCPNDKIDPYLIADRNGISHNFGSYGKAFDGLLEYKAGRFHIYGNGDRIREPNYPRARFTFSHELGHFYIDDHRVSLENGATSIACLTDFQSDSQVEREADLFGSYLLMPDKRFSSAAKGRLKGIAVVKKLADTFGTSLSSTAARYVKSDVSPAIAMGWTREKRQWCWSSSQFHAMTNNWAFKDPSRLPQDSDTVRALNDPSASTQEKGTTLSAWFPRVRAGSRDDIIMIEDVVSIGQFGVITLLYPAD